MNLTMNFLNNSVKDNCAGYFLISYSHGHHFEFNIMLSKLNRFSFKLDICAYG